MGMTHQLVVMLAQAHRVGLQLGPVHDGVGHRDPAEADARFRLEVAAISGPLMPTAMRLKREAMRHLKAPTPSQPSRRDETERA
jgi:hypothetical protein